MSRIKSPSGITTETFPFEDFQGLDDSRDIAAMDTGQKQALTLVNNGFCDWRGTITKDGGGEQVTEGNKYIQHICFYGVDLFCYAQRDGGGITLKGAMTEANEVFPLGSVVSSTVFNNDTYFFARDQVMQKFDGVSFKEVLPSASKIKPAFGRSIQRRLAVAGDPKRQGIIDISRINSDNIFFQDEDLSNTSVTRAGDIDIRNIIGTADSIKGLGVFERNRLAVFTNDQALIYQIDPDYTKWQIEDKGAIGVGTISNNTICNAGVDILFCSRYGVYTLRRSDANGITMYASPLSGKIEYLYRSLVKSVPNPEDISAFYDQDNGQYHIFFPRGTMTTRLTMTLSPVPGADVKWSTSTFLNACCGASLGGMTLLGTPGGVWERGQVEDISDISPEMVVETPILWNGSITSDKESTSFLIQARGKGTIMVEAFNEEGKPLQTWTVSVEPEDDSFLDVPLSKQYERKFEHKYKGVRFRFTINGNGLMKIIGFAVTVRK